jgi:hypothetical protein
MCACPAKVCPSCHAMISGATERALVGYQHPSRHQSILFVGSHPHKLSWAMVVGVNSRSVRQCFTLGASTPAFRRQPGKQHSAKAVRPACCCSPLPRDATCLRPRPHTVATQSLRQPVDPYVGSGGNRVAFTMALLNILNNDQIAESPVPARSTCRFALCCCC